MTKTWEYHNFKTDHRNRTAQFYCGQNVTNDEGQSVLLEAAVCLGEAQVKLESAWTEEEINNLLNSIESTNFTDEVIAQAFNPPEETL